MVMNQEMQEIGMNAGNMPQPEISKKKKKGIASNLISNIIGGGDDDKGLLDQPPSPMPMNMPPGAPPLERDNSSTPKIKMRMN